MIGFAIQDKFKAKDIKDMHAGECSALLTVCKIGEWDQLQIFLLKHGAGNSPNNNIYYKQVLW